MTYTHVIKDVCSKHLIAESIIMSETRTRSVCHARHEIMHNLNEIGYSKVEIGVILNRDHTTVIHGIRKHLGQEKKVKLMPPLDRENNKMTEFRYKIRKIGMPVGTMKLLIQEHLSNEVLDHCISEAAANEYSSMAEYFADVITEAYFLEKKNEQR